MLENLTPPKYVTACKVRTILGQLDDKDKKIFQDALDNEELWPAIALQRGMRSAGIDIGQEVIRRHRTKVCSCSKI